jgi:hypothetical protein
MINLTLTVDEVNLVLTALSKLPLESSLNTFMKVKSEAEKQVRPPAPPAEPPADAA